MIIGVDAGALSIRDDRLKVGVYRVIVNLLQEISRLDTENEYRLYSFQSLQESLLGQLSTNMESVVLRPKYGWFKFRLPISLFVHPVQIFLGVSQAVPLGLQKNIGFIYDLGFIHYPKAYPNSYQRLVTQTNQVIARSKKIITISEHSKKDICEHFPIAEENVVVAYPGVDTRFRESGKKFIGKSPYFLHVGSLKPGKNIPTLIKAFAAFNQKTNNHYSLLVIGGDYWLDQEILTTIEALELEDSVRLLGYVPDEVLPEYYRGAVSFVSTSITEGFCLPVLEAMAAGCPVIASNAGAFPEVAPEESLLFPPDDIDGFASGMEKIATNTEFRDIVIAKGLAKNTRFEWKAFAQTVLDCIHSVS